MYNLDMISKIDSKKIKILWLGTPLISAIVLEKLIKAGFNIVGVVAQIDKPVGRKKEVLPVSTKVVALKYKINVYQPIKIRLDYEFVKEINPDLILTLAYGQIIPQGLLDIPKYGCLNLHGSLLPQYRGAAPMQYSLLNGDKKTGITLMEMVDKMDAGRMFLKEEVEITDDDNLDSLTLKMADAAYNAVINGLDDYLNGINKGVEQDESLVTLTAKIKPEDQVINFNNTAISIHNKIRALTTDPGCFFVANGINFRVASSKVVDIKCDIGKVYQYDKTGLYIGTGEKVIQILTIQKPGKKMMAIKDFYNGNQSLFLKNDILK